MNEDLHNSDENFKKAYEHFEDIPSEEVWDKINAELDRQDAVYFRRKFIVWKYIACLFIIFSVSGVIYHHYLKTPGENSNVAEGGKESDEQSFNSQTSPGGTSNQALLKKHEDKQSQLLPEKNANAYADSSNQHSENKGGNTYQSTDQSHHEAENEQQAETRLIDHSILPGKQSLAKVSGEKNKFSTDKQDSLQRQPELFKDDKFGDQMQPEKHEKSLLTERDVLNNTGEQKTGRNTREDSAIVMQESDMKKQELPLHQQILNKKKQSRFSPYWVVTPLASIDFMYYHLDDDNNEHNSTEPDDKKDIKERENHEFSYTAGITATRQVTKKFGVKSGLLYSNIAIGIQPQTLYARRSNQDMGYKFVTSSGYAYIDTNL